MIFGKRECETIQNRVDALTDDDVKILRGIIKSKSNMTKRELIQIFWRGVAYNTAEAYRDQLEPEQR